MNILHKASIVLIGVLFIIAGINHFANPAFYTKIMPPYLPAHLELVYISGFFEILGGIGVLVSRLRRAAGWGLIALLIAVFPANVHMLLNSSEYPDIPYWALVARLPLQAVLIVWVWWANCRVCKIL